MSENKNAPAGAGTPTMAMGKGLAISFPNQEYTIAPEKKLRIFDLLQPGSENGLTLSDLVRLTGVDERSIRRRIQAERKAGKLILSDCQHGYFLPENKEDVRRFILSMSRRSREIAAVSRAAEDALARMAGQERVVGW